jgi:hypothetical protein
MTSIKCPPGEHQDTKFDPIQQRFHIYISAVPYERLHGRVVEGDRTKAVFKKGKVIRLGRSNS